MLWRNRKILSWDIWVLRISCDQVIKAIGLILPYGIFVVPIIFFFCCQLVNMCKKQMSLYGSKYCYYFYKCELKITYFFNVITQIRIFSLNLGSSIKNFKTTKYSRERSFQMEWEYLDFFFKIFQKNTAL